MYINTQSSNVMFYPKAHRRYDSTTCYGTTRYDIFTLRHNEDKHVSNWTQWCHDMYYIETQWNQIIFCDDTMTAQHVSCWHNEGKTVLC